MDPFKVLGVSASSVRSSADLDRIRQRSKELYKRYAQEKREADAKRVCQAWELIQRKFQKKKEGVSRTSSSQSLKEHGPQPPAAATGQAKEPGPAASTATAAPAAPAAAERPAEVAPASKRPRAEGAREAAPATKRPRAEGAREAAAHGARSVVRLPSGTMRLPGASPREAGATSATRPPTRQPSTASSLSRKGSTSSLQRQASTASLTKQGSASSLTRSTSKPGVDKEGPAFLVCACGERVPRKSVKQAAGFSCPACRVRAMDPFNAVLEGKYGMLRLVLVQPPAVPKSARQEATLKFHLNLPKLQKWRKLGHNIEARMCLLTNNEVQQTWPTSLEFQVNGRKAFEVAPPTPLHVRRDLPQKLSAELHSGVNSVTVTIKDDYVQRFALAIVRTVPRLPRQLCKHVPLMGEDQCRQRIIELLFSSVLEGASEEVQCGQGHDRCRLLCPITLARIQTPTRGYKCRHLQCFDLVAYLVSNLRMSAFNKRWLCPVCDLVLRPPKDLFIDTYLVKILADAEADAEEVAFDQTGTWSVSARAEPASPDSDAPGSPEEAPAAAPGLATQGSVESLAIDEGGSEAEREGASSDEGPEAGPAPDPASSPPHAPDTPASPAGAPAAGEPEEEGDEELSSTVSAGEEGDGSPQLELPADLPDDDSDLPEEEEEKPEPKEQEAAAAATPATAAAPAAAAPAAAAPAAAAPAPAAAPPAAAGRGPGQRAREAPADVFSWAPTAARAAAAAEAKAPAGALRQSPAAGAAAAKASAAAPGAAKAAAASLPRFTGQLAIKADISCLKQKLAELKGQTGSRPKGGISGIIASLPGSGAGGSQSQQPAAASPPAAKAGGANAGSGGSGAAKERPQAGPAPAAAGASKPEADSLRRKRSRMSVSFSEGESSDGEVGDGEDFAAVTCAQ